MIGKDGKDLRLRAWVRFSAPPQPRFVRPMNTRSADTSGVEPHRGRPHRNREGGAHVQAEDGAPVVAAARMPAGQRSAVLA